MPLRSLEEPHRPGGAGLLRPSARVAGFTLIELLVGMAVGVLVLTGFLALGLQQGREARQADVALRGLRELEAIDRLLLRLVRQAVAPAHEARRFEVSPAGTDLSFLARLDDGSVRALALRLSGGTLEMRIDRGAWQALHDAGTVTLAAARFEVTGDAAAVHSGSGGLAVPAAGCPPPHPPAVRWRFEAQAPSASGPSLSLPVVDRRVQVRDRVAAAGCRP